MLATCLRFPISKTTVGNLYTSFLGSVSVITGSCFKETTGAALSYAGIPACQKYIDEIHDVCGGAFFIEEASQMTSGNSMGGKAVLDFLLPEIENLTGKIVFVIAGYSKEMRNSSLIIQAYLAVSVSQ